MTIEPASPPPAPQPRARWKLSRKRRAARAPAPRPEHCLNCGMHVPETYVYCGNCGQENETSAVSFRELWREATEEFVKLDVRVFKTLGLLLFKPGVLTLEYVSGKRMRYISPFKLYIFVTALFAFVLFRTLQLDDTLLYAQQQFEAQTAKSRAGKAPRPPGAPGGLTVKVNGQPAMGPPGSFLAFDRPVRLAGVAIDPKTLPETVMEYRVRQNGLAAEQRDSPVRAFLTERFIKIKREPYGAVQSLLSTALPITMFCLLPFYALLMRLVYLRSGRLYAEHLVFALHTHSFLFLLLTVDSLLPEAGWGVLATLVVYPLYHLLAMRRFYGQPWPRTLLKASMLSAGYLFLLLFAVSAAFVFSLVGLLLGA
ncbi:MAG TPA: DUF3667 domain-containing protein [Armatimonadaceae bacterium]|nr:DUF3667 domain-containing protein [Armatimonadaceae bacterium]